MHVRVQHLRAWIGGVLPLWGDVCWASGGSGAYRGHEVIFGLKWGARGWNLWALRGKKQAIRLGHGLFGRIFGRMGTLGSRFGRTVGSLERIQGAIWRAAGLTRQAQGGIGGGQQAMGVVQNGVRGVKSGIWAEFWVFRRKWASKRVGNWGIGSGNLGVFCVFWQKSAENGRMGCRVGYWMLLVELWMRRSERCMSRNGLWVRRFGCFVCRAGCFVCRVRRFVRLVGRFVCLVGRFVKRA